MTNFQALILGIVQGITEFLPVSSSGHLVLFQHFFGLSEDMLVFDIFMHFGSLAAILIVFRTSVINLLKACGKGITALLHGKSAVAEWFQTNEGRIISAIIVGTLPAVLVGLGFKEQIETLFSSVVPVLFALSFTGILLIATFTVKQGDNHITPLKGLIIGIAQAIAITPGISRSGSTIATALLMGVERKESGEFSFLLAIPAVAGATILALGDVAECGISTVVWGPVLIGTIASFLSSWLSLVLLMKIVRYGKIGYFGFYCLALSLAGFVFLR